MALSLESSTDSGIVTAIADCRVNVTGHVSHEELTSLGGVHSTLPNAFRQCFVMEEIEAWTKEAWQQGLYHAMKRIAAS